MDSPKLKIDTTTVGDLIEDFGKGHVAIPEFQREYVWTPKQAVRLLDSLYRNYPIASLLLWENTGDASVRRRDAVIVKRNPVGWLIDGQQRVTSLAQIMAGEEGIDVVFNAENEVFALPSSQTEKDPANWVHVSHLWDDGLFRGLRRDLDNSGHSTRIEDRFEQVRQILKSKVPVVRMVGHRFEDAVEAFERINTNGTKLKNADIQSAKLAAKHTGFVADSVVPFLVRLHSNGYSRINVMHLFRVCTFIAHDGAGAYAPALHELETKTVQTAWRKTEQATNQAIAMVKSELGLVNMDILWSGSLLVPVIALCAVTPPSERDPKAYVGWLALAALLHRYSGASETALDEDLRACRHKDPIGALLKNLKSHRSSLQAEPHDFERSLADRNGLLALYVACKQSGLLDFATSGQVILQAQIDKHHILPRSLFPGGERSRADNLANIAFISSDINRSVIRDGSPGIYLTKIKTAALDSQCVPRNKKLWSVAGADEFWNARRQLLVDAFNAYTQETLPRRIRTRT